MQNLLKEKGIKVTPGRLAILNIFSKGKKPLDARAIYRKVKKFEINEVTVYRTLEAFEKEGILRRVELRKESLHFELAEKHHHHFICTKCDEIEDFENEELEKVLAKIISSKFSSRFKLIKEHSLELFGLCAKCA